MHQAIKNTQQGYGWVAILFHWLVALSVFGLFGLGLYMVELSYYDAWYKGSLDLHKSIGVLLAITVLLRFAWRQFNPVPKGLSGKTWENHAAHYAHLALYALMAALFVSGYLISTADGRSIPVFGWFEIPATLTGKNQEDLAGDIHEWLAWSLIALVGLHSLAALKHHFINRDDTLRRMLSAKRNRP